MARKICNFSAEDGHCPVQEFLQRIEPKQRKKVMVQLHTISIQPDMLGPPLVKAFRTERYKGLYELRSRIKQMVRIIFFLGDDGSIVLLHGFIKNHERATEQALELARARKQALATGHAGIVQINLLSKEGNS